MNIEREKELQSQIEQLRSELEGWYEWAHYKYARIQESAPSEYEDIVNDVERELSPYYMKR